MKICDMLNALSIQTQFKSTSIGAKKTTHKISSGEKTPQVTKSSSGSGISKPIKSSTVTAQKISQPAKPAKNGNHDAKNGAISHKKINILA